MFKSHLQAVNWCDVLHMVTLCLNENKLTANEKSCNADEGQLLHCSAPRWSLWGHQLRPGDDGKVGTPHLQTPPSPSEADLWDCRRASVQSILERLPQVTWTRDNRFFSINHHHDHEPHYHHLDNNHQELVSANLILPVRDQYRMVKDFPFLSVWGWFSRTSFMNNFIFHSLHRWAGFHL